MIVGILQLDMRLEGIKSLKEKRHVLRSLIDRCRHDFAVSISEVNDHDMWGNACLGVAYVTNNAVQAESVLQKVLDVIEEHPAVLVEGVQRELERY